MLGLADVRDWIKGIGVGESFYIGKLDAKKQKSVGIYQRKPSGKVNIAAGGLECTKTDLKQVSILLHWNKSANETERSAYKLFEQLRNAGKATMGDTVVDYIQLQVPEPIDVGTDEAGIYERVIWIDLIYER